MFGDRHVMLTSCFRITRHIPGFKKVHAEPDVYSARVGIGYRAVGVRTGATIVWFWIGSHADYNVLLRQL
jgi:hypothetical protein